MNRYRALYVIVHRLSMIFRITVTLFRIMLKAAIQRGCLPSFLRFWSCV
jgi:hypothetical protein